MLSKRVYFTPSRRQFIQKNLYLLIRNDNINKNIMAPLQKKPSPFSQSPTINIISFSVFATISCSTLVLIVAGILFHTNPIEALDKLWINLHPLPNYNYIPMPSIFNMPLISYLFLFFCMSFLLIQLFTKFILKYKLPKMNFIPHIILIVLFAIIAPLQIIGQTAMLKKFITSLNQYSMKQKNSYLTFGISQMAEYYAKFYPLCCKAEIVSDVDFSTDDGMTKLRMLNYYNLPIDTGNLRKSNQTNCRIYYDKMNALKSVPKGYVVAAVFDKKNILAINKNIENTCSP